MESGQRRSRKGRKLGSSRRWQTREPADGQDAPGAPASKSWTSQTAAEVQGFLQDCGAQDRGFVTRDDLAVAKFSFLGSQEQPERIFDWVDTEQRGHLSLDEFSSGLKSILSSSESSPALQRRRVRASLRRGLEPEETDAQEKEEFSAFMEQWGGSLSFPDEAEVWQLWRKLRQEEPQLAGNLEGLLAAMSSRLQEARADKEVLELTLRKCDSDHHRKVQKLYEEMEQQLRQEKQQLQAESESRELALSAQMQEALEAKERESQRLAEGQRELEVQIRQLSASQQQASSEQQQLREAESDLARQLEEVQGQLRATKKHLTTARGRVSWQMEQMEEKPRDTGAGEKKATAPRELSPMEAPLPGVFGDNDDWEQLLSSFGSTPQGALQICWSPPPSPAGPPAPRVVRQISISKAHALSCAQGPSSEPPGVTSRAQEGEGRDPPGHDSPREPKGELAPDPEADSHPRAPTKVSGSVVATEFTVLIPEVGGVRPRRSRGAASSQTPEDRDAASSQTPEDRDAASSQTPEDRDAASSQTPEDRDAASSQTPEDGDTASSQTPEDGDAASSQTPEDRDAASSQTPEDGDTASSQTPEDGDAASSQTPEDRDAASSQTPEDGDAASSQTPEDRDAASSQTPEDGDAASSQTPEDGDAASSQTPEDGDAASSQTPEDGDAASSQTPEDGDAASSQTPEDGDAASSQTPADGDAASSQTPEDRDAASSQTPLGPDRQVPASVLDDRDSTPEPALANPTQLRETVPQHPPSEPGLGHPRPAVLTPGLAGPSLDVLGDLELETEGPRGQEDHAGEQTDPHGRTLRQRLEQGVRMEERDKMVPRGQYLSSEQGGDPQSLDTGYPEHPQPAPLPSDGPSTQAESEDSAPRKPAPLRGSLHQDTQPGHEAGSQELTPRLPTAAESEAPPRMDGSSWESGLTPPPGSASVTNPDYVFNVIFLGDSNVGKTSFLHLLYHNSFPAGLTATVGVDFRVKNVVVDNKIFALQLWDTAGQERYHSVARHLLRKADAAVLMYDITSRDSFAHVRSWLSCFQDAGCDGVAILLLGNKTDCEEARQVSTEAGRQLAQELGATFGECSAALGHNILEPVMSLARALRVQEDHLKSSLVEVAPTRPPRRTGCCS